MKEKQWSAKPFFHAYLGVKYWEWISESFLCSVLQQLGEDGVDGAPCSGGGGPQESRAVRGDTPSRPQQRSRTRFAARDLVNEMKDT